MFLSASSSPVILKGVKLTQQSFSTCLQCTERFQEGHEYGHSFFTDETRKSEEKKKNCI